MVPRQSWRSCRRAAVEVRTAFFFFFFFFVFFLLLLCFFPS